MTAVLAPVIASERPSAVWLPGATVGKRLDATYYAVDFLRLDDVVNRHPRDSVRALGSLLSDPRRVLYMNTDTYSKEELSDGVPFISGVDIDPDTMSVRWDSVRRVEKTMCQRYPRGLLFDGALLIKVKGPNQLAAYIERSPKPTLVSGTFSMAAVKEVDPWYLVAYLVHDYAQSWRTRLRQNITVEFTPYDELAEIPVIVPNDGVQKAIGNKLRKAERLRQRSLLSQSEARREIDCLFTVKAATDDVPYGWMQARELEEDRLDSWFYQPSYRNMRDGVAARSDLIPVSERAALVTQAVDFSNWPTADFEYFEISDVDLQVGTISSKRLSVSDAPSRAKYAVKTGDVLVSTVRPNRKGVAIVGSRDLTAVCSSGFAVLRANDVRTAYYLRACLVHDLSTHQLMRWNTGATYPAIDRTVPLTVKIPWPADDVVNRIGEALKRAGDELDEATSLLSAAQHYVDALISGRLDEGQVIAEDRDIEEWLRSNPVCG